MKTKASPNTHRGSDFRDFLSGEGILPEVEVLAQRRVAPSIPSKSSSRS